MSKIELSEEQKSYIENLEKVKKTTTDEFALKLIDSFFEDLNNTKFKSSRFINCMEKYVFSKDSYTLDEIFPKDLYSTLDIFMGRNGREDFLEVVRNIRKFPYECGYYNLFRSENYRLYSKKLLKYLDTLQKKNLENYLLWIFLKIQIMI